MSKTQDIPQAIVTFESLIESEILPGALPYCSSAASCGNFESKTLLNKERIGEICGHLEESTRTESD